MRAYQELVSDIIRISYQDRCVTNITASENLLDIVVGPNAMRKDIIRSWTSTEYDHILRFHFGEKHPSVLILT